jgi:hypothetical protein
MGEVSPGRAVEEKGKAGTGVRPSDRISYFVSFEPSKMQVTKHKSVMGGNLRSAALRLVLALVGVRNGNSV